MTKQKLKAIGINIVAVVFAVIVGVPLGTILLNRFGSMPRTFEVKPAIISPEIATTLFKGIRQEFIVFGDTKCQYCKAGIAFLESQGVHYRLLNIDQDVQAKKIFEDLKFDGVPVLVSRHKYITGYSQKEWDGFLVENQRSTKE